MIDQFYSKWAEDAFDSIDAGFFSGDIFYNYEALERVEWYLARWQKRMKELRECLDEDEELK